MAGRTPKSSGAGPTKRTAGKSAGTKTVRRKSLTPRTTADAEEAIDAAALEKVLAAIAAGEDEAVPAAVVNRLLDGDNPVRVWREHRGMTMTALAEAVGSSQPYLSQVETGKREGTFRLMIGIARALDIDVQDLVPNDLAHA